MLDGSDAEENIMPLLEKFSTEFPQAALVLLIKNQTPEILLAAIRAGVREVLELPLQQSLFHAALDRIDEKLQASKKNEGKILAFLSAKGGSGATFLSTNLAYTLAMLTHKKIIVIDLNSQLGDTALHLSDQKPSMTLADLCAQINRLDADLLEASLIHVTPNCGVLAGTSEAAPTTEIQPDQIEAILQLARTQYDFVLLDMGRQINAVTIRALDHAYRIYPVLQQSFICLRDGKYLLDMFRSLGYAKEKIEIIVNRHGSAEGVSMADMDRMLGLHSKRLVPNNYELANASINQGVPIFKLAHTSNIGKSLIDFSNSLANIPLKNEPGMIRRLFSKRAESTQK
jgi:pilus assembly protein CpaE